MRSRFLAILALLIVLPAGMLAQPRQVARAALDPAMNRTWARTDYPVEQGQAARTWMWGPSVRYELSEPYRESPGGQRKVAYFDKSRMEITNPNGDSNSIWYVTNGLLVMELITGRMQVGDNAFEQHLPAEVNVAGDPDDQHGPVYASFYFLLDAPSIPDGSLITQRVDRDGNVTDDPSLASRGVRAAHRVQVPNLDHQIAAPFWVFMNSSGIVFENGFVEDRLFEDPFYATGLPVTEAYWAAVKVGGQVKDVLLQCFERRCLTYTPDNAPEWQVEAGNVGDHYYRWRYCGEEGEIVFAPALNESEPWTDGDISHYYDPALSAYVVEDRTPMLTSSDSSWSYTWWSPSETRPKDYSVTVDIITLSDDVTDQSAAGLLYRVRDDEFDIIDFTDSHLFTNGLALSIYSGPDGGSRLTDPDEIPVFHRGYGAVNRMKVVVRGATARVYVNSSFVQEFTLDPRADLLANGFGLIVYRFYPGDQPVTRFGFQNLYVRELKDTGC